MRWLRIRLRTAFILFTLTPLLVPLVAPLILSLGASALEFADFVWRDSWQALQSTPVSEVVPVACAVGGIGIAASITVLVLYLGSNREFVVLAVLTGMGLPALIAGLSLETPPLGTARLQEATDLQLVRVALLLFGSVAPVSALLSWLGTLELQR